MALPVADSDEVRVGDFVVAIGSPFGLGQTVTYGIVSALGRSGPGIEGYEDFIQTDASINPGNSGGPLVNMNGELVGVNTAIVGPSGGNIGIGFAIPGNMASVILQHLSGATLGAISDNHVLAGQVAGVQVLEVERGSPAWSAGLRADDIIVSLNQLPVSSMSDMEKAVGRNPAALLLNIRRGNGALFIVIR